MDLTLPRPRTLALAATLATGAPLAGQDAATAVEGSTFHVFDSRGRPSSFAELLEAMDRADVVLVGEEHDDMVGHAVELEILKRAVERYSGAGSSARRPVTLSLEMFERDVQYVVDEYFADLITEEHFLSSSRPWPDYENRYRPLVEHAREVDIPLVAANAPRRYVNRVTRLGPASLQGLPESARAFLPPLPYPPPSEEYRSQWMELMGGAMARSSEPADSQPSPHAPGPVRPEMDPMRFALDAQALWDASMAESVALAAGRATNSLVVHMVGVFHVERFTGIPEALRHYDRDLRQLVVVVRPEDDDLRPTRQDLERRGDFVILTSPRVEATGGS